MQVHGNRILEDGTVSELPLDLVQFMVVDDYAFIRRIVGQCLKSFGVNKFIAAEDGREAINILRQRPTTIRDSTLADMISARPDVARDLSPNRMELGSSHSYCVITDFGMPHTNGLQLLKTIRCGQTSVARDTPVILLTGYSEDYVIAAALELDVSAYIVKPVSHNALLERVKCVLKAKISLKDPAVYAKVQIPDEKGQVMRQIGNAAGPKTCNVEANEDQDMRWLPTMAIQPGAVLAKDLKTDSGALLLQAGAVLSGSAIRKLFDIHRAGGLSGNIPIIA